MANFTKEAIAHRMVKNALSFWNLRDAEDLDPVVKMMIEALSVELHQLNQAHYSAQVNTLDRAARLMAADYVTSPIPASSLMYMHCVESTDIIKQKHHFTYQHKITTDDITGKQENINLSFTPAVDTRIYDLHPAVLITPNAAFTLNDFFQKEKSASIPPSSVDEHTLWLGLRSNNSYTELDNLICYVRINGLSATDHKEAIRFIPYFKFYQNNFELSSQMGLTPSKVKNEPADAASTIGALDTIEIITQDVLAHYHPQLVSLSCKDCAFSKSAQTNTPFSEHTPEHDVLSGLNQEKLYWIKVVVPIAFKKEWINHIHLYTNAVPVVNRKFNESKHRLRRNFNIVHLSTENDYEQFLAVDAVSDEHTKFTASGSFESNSENREASYTLIEQGLERFDSRTAQEHINNLMDLLRSESSAFAVYGYDFIASMLKELSQKIALIEQKTVGKQKSFGHDNHYLLLSPLKESTVIYADYWTTTGTTANGLQATSRLMPNKHTVVKSGKSFLIEPCTHGRNRPTPHNRLLAFRYNLMARNTIVTKQDIIQFCEMELGTDLQSIQIQSGTAFIGESNYQVIKTTDVLLRLAGVYNDDEKRQITQRLEAQLHTRGIMGITFRVKIVD